MFESGDRFLRFAIDVTTPGRLNLVLRNGKDIRVWIKGEAVRFPRGTARLTFTKGRHDVVVHVGAATQAESFSIEMRNARRSKAVGQLLGE